MNLRLSLPALVCAPLLMLVAGCSLAPTSQTSGVTMPALQGQVHGGQQGVVGATITAYATGKTGYGSASRQLATTTSGPNGSFSLSAASQCLPGDNLYIVATGGNPAGSGTANNSALAMMVGLGPCAAITNTTKVSINELTTVASVWALAPFMADMAHIGTSATNALGLTNAFASITGKLVNTGTGVVPSASLPATVTLPVAEINTLADILAACINTVDSTAPASQSGTCQTVLGAVAVNGVMPANTLQAALNLATHPTLGLTLIAQVVPNAPYQPTLPASPTSWTIAIQHAAPDNTANTPVAVAIDPGGYIYTVGSGNGRSSIISIAPSTGSAGEFHPGGGVLNTASAMAIDTAGNIWVGDSAYHNVAEFPPTGSNAGATTYSVNGSPSGLAFDAQGNVWVTLQGSNSVTEFTGSGGYIGNFTSSIANPVAIAVSPY